jgi:UDP-glucose 4-epimerase
VGVGKMRVVVTGSQGFIGSFLCQQLLDKGYEVVGVDNFSKYGEVDRPHDKHKNFKLLRLNLAQEKLPLVYLDPDFIIAGAAMIGGISYFHKYAYDLLATNERIIANTFDSIIELKKLDPNGINLRRVIVISSSMVFEGADAYFDQHGKHLLDDELPWPTSESMIKKLPPPLSTYGFQKLATEYFAKGAWEQYKLPYTIVRPFNCVGVGEGEAIGDVEVMSGNVKLMMSHVLPDLIKKCLAGQDPLHILGDGEQVRCYTNGHDVARGIIMAMESDKAVNEDFNISNPIPHSVLALAKMVWEEINPGKEFRYLSDPPFEYDVQMRLPETMKARELLGFEAEIPIKQSIKEVIEWMKRNESKQL